jgi:hypothetical protein
MAEIVSPCLTSLLIWYPFDSPPLGRATLAVLFFECGLHKVDESVSETKLFEDSEEVFVDHSIKCFFHVKKGDKGWVFLFFVEIYRLCKAEDVVVDESSYQSLMWFADEF